jgi:hypothetical protein
VCGEHHASAAFTPGKEPVPIVQEAGWAPEPVWIGAENLAPPGFDPPDLPARSESLYRLRYPGSQVLLYLAKFWNKLQIYADLEQYNKYQSA